MTTRKATSGRLLYALLGGALAFGPAAAQERATLRGHPEPVWCLAFSPDGRTLASAGEDPFILLWEVLTGKERARVREAGGATALAFAPDGRTLATARHRLKLWDVFSGRPRLDIPGHRACSRGVAFSPDGKAFASGGPGRAATLREAATGRDVVTLKGSPGFVSCVAFSPDGKLLAAGGGSIIDDNKPSEVRLWDVEGLLGRKRDR